MIKHISFDLWLTLIKSHPLFKQKRAELISAEYNEKGFSAHDIDLLIREIDKDIDRNNESTGQKMPAVQMYHTILQQTCVNHESLMIKAKELELKSNELFKEYSPVLLNNNIIEVLEVLKAEGYGLNLSSNTGFIEGNTLRVVLDKIGILKFFDFLIFSDEVEASKPSSRFFQALYDRLKLEKDEVLHVGDNKLTDYKGASTFGFKAHLITNKNYSINDIKRHL